jgi:hypothetical protein
MLRNLRAFAPAAFAALTLAAVVVPADAATGEFSLGAHASRGF